MYEKQPSEIELLGLEKRELMKNILEISKIIILRQNYNE